MDTELSSFLTQVWENREAILNFRDRPPATIESVRDGVYNLYAPKFRAVEERIKVEYELRLQGIRVPPRSGWNGGHTRGEFFVWDNTTAASGTVAHRVYANARTAVAAAVFQRVLDVACREREPRLPPPRPGEQRAPAVGAGADLTPGYLALAQRGRFGDTVVGAKIAHADEAFGGRYDVIVVYLNNAGGPLVATLLAQRMASWGPHYHHDHPPMTQRIASGISVGPEVTMAQRGIGNSFGELRCGLIGRALIEAVTGAVPAEGDRPLLPPRPGVERSPNRLDFNRIVARRFTEYGLDVQAPWA